MRATLLTLLCMFSMLVLAGGTASAQQMTANDSGMSATVAPGTGLYNNQVVNLSWSGFPAGGAVYVEECASNATSLDKCVRPPGDFTEFVSDTNGSGLVRYSIVEGPLGSFTCDANVGHDCSLVLMTAPPDLNSGPHVQLKWAPDQGPCPGAKGLPVGGEGASPAAYTMYAWEADGCKTKQHLSVTYTNDNSYDGMSHFVDHFPGTNFAVTGVSMPANEAAQVAKKKLGFGYAPLTLTGLAIGFNIVDQSGNQVQHLVLTPHILAEIATNQLSSFYCPAKASPSKCINDYGGDPQIQQLNPGVQFPTGPVQFFIRAEQSASNLAFSTWLSDNASDLWTWGPTRTWPPTGAPASIPQGVTGEANTAHAVGFPASYDPNQVYIGVMDTTDAAINDIPVASIDQTGAPSGVAPTAASLAAAVADGTKNADGTVTPNYTTQDANAYPMPMLSYAVVPTTRALAALHGGQREDAEGLPRLHQHGRPVRAADRQLPAARRPGRPGPGSGEADPADRANQERRGQEADQGRRERQRQWERDHRQRDHRDRQHRRHHTPAPDLQRTSVGNPAGIAQLEQPAPAEHVEPERPVRQRRPQDRVCPRREHRRAVVECRAARAHHPGDPRSADRAAGRAALAP